jgi:type I restriction enzyme R subunit
VEEGQQCESEPGRISLETMLRGTCEPARLLDLVENFTLFMDVPGGQIKMVAKNHQYLGVNSAMTALAEIKERQGAWGYSGIPRAAARASP